MLNKLDSKITLKTALIVSGVSFLIGYSLNKKVAVLILSQK